MGHRASLGRGGRSAEVSWGRVCLKDGAGIRQRRRKAVSGVGWGGCP